MTEVKRCSLCNTSWPEAELDSHGLCKYCGIGVGTVETGTETGEEMGTETAAAATPTGKRPTDENKVNQFVLFKEA